MRRKNDPPAGTSRQSEGQGTPPTRPRPQSRAVAAGGASTIIVVNTPKNWPFEMPGVEIVSARRYLTETQFGHVRRTKVYNLCRSYSYQSLGYYVSLLAQARGHRPIPSIQTIQELRNPAVLRLRYQDFDKLIQAALKGIQTDEFLLSIYFGRNLAAKYDRLALALFNSHPAPLLRARFEKLEGRWRMDWIRPVPASELPDNHRPFVAWAAHEHLSRKTQAGRPKRHVFRYDLAVLVNTKVPDYPPSDEKALRKFERAADKADVRVERIEPNDAGRLLEFDGLFIRETTSVDHHTYRFAVRAEAAGLFVIDDPESIVRCTNKVYLAESLARYGIPAPRSIVLHDGNVGQVAERLGFPLILKQPDSSFSHGVFKVHDAAELAAVTEKLLHESDLLIAQEFVPSEFDWRIGVLGGKALYACRYYMAEKHWQIIQWKGGDTKWGKVDTIPVEDAPRAVVRNAVRAANLMGNGLYGVDLKQRGNRAFVIEVNDNPSLESGYEDRVLGDALYARLIDYFVKGMEASRSPSPVGSRRARDGASRSGASSARRGGATTKATKATKPAGRASRGAKPNSTSKGRVQ